MIIYVGRIATGLTYIWRAVDSAVQNKGVIELAIAKSVVLLRHLLVIVPVFWYPLMRLWHALVDVLEGLGEERQLVCSDLNSY